MRLAFVRIRPELIALSPSVFWCLARWDYHGHIVLYDHLPEVVGGLRQGTLRSNDFLVAEVWPIRVFKGRIDVACIDVIWGFIIVIKPSHQFDSTLVVSEDVRVPIPLLIVAVFVHQQLLYNIISVEYLLKDVVLFCNSVRWDWTFVLFEEIRHFHFLHELRVLLN